LWHSIGRSAADGRSLTLGPFRDLGVRQDKLIWSSR
jgi:hypothetical protein